MRFDDPKRQRWWDLAASLIPEYDNLDHKHRRAWRKNKAATWGKEWFYIGAYFDQQLTLRRKKNAKRSSAHMWNQPL